MSEEPIEPNKLQLAVALAQGSSISEWARANNVAKETARRWSHEREVLDEIEAFRRHAIDRAVGILAKNASWAAGEICKLAGDAESESVKLSALRAVLADVIAVSKYSGLEERMGELEAHVRQQQGAGVPHVSEFNS
jgi:hypothetical protein